MISFRKIICFAFALLTFDIFAMKKSDQVLVEDISVGGIRVTDQTGLDTSNEARLKTGFWPLGTMEIEWDASTGYEYFAVYYDKNFNFLKATGFLNESRTIKEDDVPGAKYVRFVFSFQAGKHSTQNNSLPKTCFIRTRREFAPIGDIPESDGAKNMILRAEQCVNVPFVTRSVLPAQDGDIPAGVEQNGVMYSSVRKESLYVPNAVSFETYVTALNNPNSYIYTRTSMIDNSRTYYGTVCSAFASYCYDLPIIYTTYQLGSLDEMERLENQSIDSIQLGDMILKEEVHVSLVIGIDRDMNGRVLRVTEAEATTPRVWKKTYNRNEYIRKRLDNGYEIYRYLFLDRVSYCYSQWADPAKSALPINHNLCPRRGDKANWPAGEPIEIDILDAEDYRNVVLYKDDEYFDKFEIPDNKYICIDGLESGKYDVCLTNNEHQSEYASFIIVDTKVQTEKIDEGKIKISFCSSNARAKWLAWCNVGSNKKLTGIDGIDQLIEYYTGMGVEQAYVITDTDRLRGYSINQAKTGKWLIKVEFETEYGLISSNFVEIDLA